MKKLVIRCTTILLAFLAGVGFMSYVTYIGNRDMTAAMAGATLPVAYAQWEGQLCNEMHGYVEPMDGSCMKESLLGLSEDHRLSIAVEKYNAHVEGMSYELRSLDRSRLIEDRENIPLEDDGRYVYMDLDFKDLMERGEKYLLILKARTEEHGEVYFYSQISYLGENHVKECVDFARQFHEATLQKDTNHELLRKLEPESGSDGKNLGYVNIHSYPRTVTWGDMPVAQVAGEKIRFTDIRGDIVSLVMEYEIENTQTRERYQVSEAFCIQYTQTQMYLQNYERTADRIFRVEGQLVEEQKIDFGIQSSPVNYQKNDEENVLGFVQQGQLWCYDFGQNRLSRVYGFEDGDDARGFYDAHEFRILQVEDSGSMDFLVYGYMNRGIYEGRSGILLCHYDALMNTVEERYFLPSEHSYQVIKEELGKLSVVNENDLAWLSYCGMILKIDLTDCSVQILADNIDEKQLQVSRDGYLAAWTGTDGESISFLNVRDGRVYEISSEENEVLQVLGFMEEDFIYGTAYRENIRISPAGQQVIPMHRVIIRDHSGNEVREFDYASRGKYVTDVTIIDNRIDLSCISLLPDGKWEETLPEPITYTSDPVEEKLRLEIASDEVKRNEYHFQYEGTLKRGSMKRPRVRMVLYEENRMLSFENRGKSGFLAWDFTGSVKGYDTLAEAVTDAHNGMGSVWKNGYELLWERWNRPSSMQIEGFEHVEPTETAGSSLAVCIQMLLRQKQIYTDVQAYLDQGMAVWEIFAQELGEKSCLLPGCSLRMALYYVSRQEPVMGITDTGDAVLIVGYDAQNIIYYEAGQTAPEKAGMKDSTEMFERAGNLFFTCQP